MHESSMEETGPFADPKSLIDMPLDLRHKKTRAMRRALTHKEKSAITEKQHKRDIHFPQRSECGNQLGGRSKVIEADLLVRRIRS